MTSAQVSTVCDALDVDGLDMVSVTWCATAFQCHRPCVEDVAVLLGVFWGVGWEVPPMCLRKASVAGFSLTNLACQLLQGRKLFDNSSFWLLPFPFSFCSLWSLKHYGECNINIEIHAYYWLMTATRSWGKSPGRCLLNRCWEPPSCCECTWTTTCCSQLLSCCWSTWRLWWGSCRGKTLLSLVSG